MVGMTIIWENKFHVKSIISSYFVDLSDSSLKKTKILFKIRYISKVIQNRDSDHVTVNGYNSSSPSDAYMSQYSSLP